MRLWNAGIENRDAAMPWDLGLPLLVALVTLILSFGIFWSAKTLLFDARRREGIDSQSDDADAGRE